MLKNILISMRPKQWYKNIFLFAGIIFSSNFLNSNLLLDSFSAFIIFCMLSGAEYIINDIIDINKDKNHPVKLLRPIASEKIEISYALFFAFIIIVLVLFWSNSINVRFLWSSFAYLLLIFLYSLWLKHIIIVDILVISMGFVIRAIAGCLAINVLISPWLIICTFLLALFLALGKRKNELILLGDNAKNHREILEEYSIGMLDQMVSITTGALVVSYSLYTFFIDNYYLMLTIPFVIYGLFRYLLLVNTRNFGGETEMLFKDKGMLFCIVCWCILVIFTLYKLRGV